MFLIFDTHFDTQTTNYSSPEPVKIVAYLPRIPYSIQKYHFIDFSLGTRSKTLPLKFRYAGHIMRENRNKWNKILTNWLPHWGKRGRGRPSTRWSDELRMVAGTDWYGKANNRENWKDLVKTYVQKWAVEGVE